MYPRRSPSNCAQGRQSGLLPEVCIGWVERMAWHNIRYVEPESITPLQIQEKYGFDWRYQECILEPCEGNEQDGESTAEPARTDEVQTLSKQIIDKNREVYESLASTDKERSE